MGEKTGISWTNHTFNPWIGCTKVSEGCRFCYAERDNRRFQWVAEWGKGKPRRPASEASWKRVLLWDRMAAKAGKPAKVFCGSLMDILDSEVPQEWRERVWNYAEQTPHLIWLFLTKRPLNGAKMVRAEWKNKPPKNVWFGITVESQLAINRIPALLSWWDGHNFLSVEPMIGGVDLDWVIPATPNLPLDKTRQFMHSIEAINWVICGAESGMRHRITEEEWVRNLRDQCLTWKVPFFLKQLWIGGTLEREPFFDERQWLEFPEAMNGTQHHSI